MVNYNNDIDQLAAYILDETEYMPDDALYEEYEYEDADNILNESIKVKWVVRNGKKIKKFKSTKAPKYKIQIDKTTKKPKEVRIKNSERRNRRIGQLTGKARRLAEINNITKKRKRSFIARKNVGLAKYNTKLPDVITARAEGRFVKSDHPNKVKLIHPAMPQMEMFRINKHNLLCESPYTTFWINPYDEDDEIAWDWCSEARQAKNGKWLLQLIDLFTPGIPMVSLRDDRNISQMLNLEDYGITMNDRKEALLTDTNSLFWNVACNDYKELSIEDKELLRNNLPTEIYLRLQG